MALNKEKKQNIMTAVIVAIALIMAVTVVLVKTGVFKKEETETTTEVETVIESTIIIESTVDDSGDVSYYTMVKYYEAPKIKSNHRYPTTTTTTDPSETEESSEESSYIEKSTVVAVTDENGELQTDANGEPVTEVIVYTEPVTESTSEEETSETETTTEYVELTEVSVVTDKYLKRPKIGPDGKKVTTIIVLNPTTETTTEADIWSEKTESTATTVKESVPQVTANVTRDDNLASAIVTQINDDRAAQGLEPLTVDGNIRGAARTNSLAMAVPDMASASSEYDRLYTYSSSYGGKELYNVIATSGAGKTAMSEDVSYIGVGVVKSGDKYYTTIIFQ